MSPVGDDVLAYIDGRPDRMFDFVDWRMLVIQLAERVCLADILGEPLQACEQKLKRLLLVDSH